MILFASCDGGAGSTDDRLYPEVEGAVCQPRALRTCDCDDGTSSIQFCHGDASGWGDCQCCGADGIDCTSTAFECGGRMAWIEYAVPVYGPSDVLYGVSERAIQRFDCAAGIREQVDGPGIEPQDAAVFSNGAVAARGGGTMVIVSASGERIPLDVSQPQSFAIDAEDRLWVSRACASGSRELVVYGADGALLAEGDPCECRVACEPVVQRVGDVVVGFDFPSGPASLDVIAGAVDATPLGGELPALPDSTGFERYYRGMPHVGDGPSLRTVLAMQERTGVSSWLRFESWLADGLSSDHQSGQFDAGTFGMEVGAFAMFQRGDRLYIDVNARDGDAGPFPIIVLERGAGITASVNDTNRLAVDSVGNVATIVGGHEILLLTPDLLVRTFD